MVELSISAANISVSRTDRNDHRPHRGWSRRLRRALRNAIMLTATCTFIPPARTQDLPDGMVFLAAVDPSIRQDIRYAGSNNFTGRPVAGYLVGECILAKPVAYALARAQAALLPRYSLKVFDCYRPLRAVADFLAWSRTTGQEHTRTAYYPDLRKGDLFARGFIARRSRHTRGTAVDVTIIEIADTAPVLPVQSLSTPCSSSLEPRLHDSNLDYGTGFDCFSAKSSTNSALISPEARRNRRRLVAAMRKVGFTNYGKEWWHFELDGLADLAERDIPISARSGPAVGARSTQEGCGSPRVEVSCANDAAPIVIHEGPGVTTPSKGELASRQKLTCLRCTGRVPLPDFAKLDALSRSTGEVPWCEVRSARGEVGWVDGRYLAPENHDEVDCTDVRR